MGETVAPTIDQYIYRYGGRLGFNRQEVQCSEYETCALSHGMQCMQSHADSSRFKYNLMQTVKEFIEKVKANGNKDVTLYMYSGEGHGFMNGGQDIHKMMKSKFTPTVSDVRLCDCTAADAKLCWPFLLYSLLRYIAARCL